jgi:hypothetical protein
MNVTSMFTVTPEGTLRVRSLPAFRAAIMGRFDPYQLSVHAFDANGASYRGTTSPFAIGRYSVRVQLASPVDTQATLGSVFVRVTNERTGMSFWSKTATDGTATFTHLPDGRFQIASDVVRTSERLFGRGSFELVRDNMSVPIRLFSTREGRESAHVKADTTVGNATTASAGRSETGIRGPEPQWHRANEASALHKVLEVALNLTPAGTLRPAWALEFESWELTDSLSEEVLKVALQNDSPSNVDPDQRPIAVRVYDAGGHVIYRTSAILELVHRAEGGRYGISQPYVLIVLPADVTGRLQTEASDARLDISFDIGAIRSEFLH